MKQYICLVICFLYYCDSTTLFAKEKIHWQTIHWPPWMILEGKYKGQGFADHLLQAAKQELTEYEQIPVRMNWARFWLVIQQGKNYCSVLSMKNPSREEIAYFSEPEAIVLNNELTVTKATAQLLDNPVSIYIRSLLIDNRFHGGIETKRSYGVKIDQLLIKHNQNILPYATSASSLLYMLTHKRIDYIIEYPIVVSYFTRNIQETSSLTSIKIKEIPEVFYGYLTCTKNDWGKRVVNRWNQVLRKLKQTKQYQLLIESGYSKPDDIKTLRKYYPCFINNSLEQQCTTLHE
ncbi:TIGR02285 family protein [Spartinivicinus poritis]|uniref:TIGR02285 family protein n=1 Tax=Spartinivicinus poritis TaxID=2994640 RepID=A0ABT5U8M9_9GAMM|nr:TIGR02285 family protein [Spartinivicinus sp. A2-2]MDE1462729.1 TIGR02285 family protein [Spartinivicinus sp. A2-2]